MNRLQRRTPEPKAKGRAATLHNLSSLIPVTSTGIVSQIYALLEVAEVGALLQMDGASRYPTLRFRSLH
ncbi:hypothetical protein NXC12_CH02618 [Rhizobium etli]|uniref:Uncharacterized protein n=1 Tax=Rhizobium etli TaxID=29449 RepID=A0AAN1BGJ8_RHIET|nr:hypothetical protein NXC12_CH02618 [Rhizobium etli]